MADEKAVPGSIDEYIAAYPADVRARLDAIRRLIREVLPAGAEETIRYGIPTFRLRGRNLIHFAAHARHLSLYPAPRGVESFAEELAGYRGGKGTLQLPLADPLPLDLIRRIVRFRLQESEAGN